MVSPIRDLRISLRHVYERFHLAIRHQVKGVGMDQSNLTYYSVLLDQHRNFTENFMKQFSVHSLEEKDIEALSEPNRTWFRWGLGGFQRAEQTFSLLQKFKKYEKGLRHLDIGCGPGYLSAVYAKNGFQSIGIDIDDLAQASYNLLDFPSAKLEYLNIDCTKEDVSKLGKFDIITIDNVIEHVESPSILIRNVKKLLNKNGIVYLIVPNAYSIELVKSDPHYNTFGLSLVDKKCGDRIVQALFRDQGSYEVNDFFSKYDLANYTAIFEKYGFISHFLDEHLHGTTNHRIRIFDDLDIDDLVGIFDARLESLSKQLPADLHEKLKYITDIYLDELKNDYSFASAGKRKNAEFILGVFMTKYFLSSWFFILQNGDCKALRHTSLTQLNS